MTLWQMVLGLVGIALLLFIWRAHRSTHAFNLFDILMDQATNRASLNAVILVVMAALSCWVIVDRELHGKDDLSTLLLGVLGVFVTGRVVAQGIAAFKPAQDGSSVREVVRETTTTTPTSSTAETEVQVNATKTRGTTK